MAGFRVRKSVFLSCPFLLPKLSPVGFENSLGVGVEIRASFLSMGARAHALEALGCHVRIGRQSLRTVAAVASDVAIVCMLVGMLIVSARS